MAQGLADRWRFSSVDESARLVMTLRLRYPIIPCPAPYPRSLWPVPPHREGMMGWWMFGAVGKAGKTIHCDHLCPPYLFSLLFKTHTLSLLLLYRRKHTHTRTVKSFSLAIPAEEQWLIPGSFIHRLHPSLNEPIMGVYVFVLLWWGWVGRETLRSWTANQWCFSAKSLSLSCTHFSIPSFQHQLPLSVSLSLAFLPRSINRGMVELPSQLTMKQTSSAAAVVLETVVLSLRHDGFKSFISIMRIPLLKWHA